MSTIFPQCYFCKHYLKNYKCAAFVDRIPDEILKNEHDHNKPFEGDGGITFEKKK